MSLKNTPSVREQALQSLKDLGEQIAGRGIDAAQSGPDLKWAEAIMRRYHAGERIKAATLNMARDALRAAGRQP
jgi:hypothetical protein